MRRSLLFFPLVLPMILAFAVILAFVIALVELDVLHYAYERAGMGPRTASVMLIVSLVGSVLNVPVARVPTARTVSDRIVEVFGMRYVIPLVEQERETIVAVNVGGALVPTLVSLYLLVRTGLWTSGIVGTALVAAVAHAFARPVRGVGITVPWIVPPVAAAIVAVMLAPAAAPALAYVAGSVGTLVGADLANLHRLGGLDAPVASIGGAGCFDGIFLTGVLAVLLA